MPDAATGAHEHAHRCAETTRWTVAELRLVWCRDGREDPWPDPEMVLLGLPAPGLGTPAPSRAAVQIVAGEYWWDAPRR